MSSRSLLHHLAKGVRPPPHPPIPCRFPSARNGDLPSALQKTPANRSIHVAIWLTYPPQKAFFVLGEAPVPEKPGYSSVLVFLGKWGEGYEDALGKILSWSCIDSLRCSVTEFGCQVGGELCYLCCACSMVAFFFGLASLKAIIWRELEFFQDEGRGL